MADTFPAYAISTPTPAIHHHQPRKSVLTMASSLVTFGLLFQPSASASGPRGEVSTDAFGRIDGEHLRTWTPGKENYILLSSTWGMLAAVSALITIVAGVLYMGSYQRTWASIMLVASAVTMVSACGVLLYLHNKAPELRELTTMPPDGFTSGVRAALHRLLGTDSSETNPASAKLEVSGAIAIVTAIGSFGASICTRIDHSLRFSPELQKTSELLPL